ncbi:hypothetical protein [uncultured Draconibacterium sp.]|uniref:hypothetical protein n=1 Tax=uncultured Draconibacterium sp. TaxID=1573823 RepID=UPI0025F7AC74|nr:hypothetical protein [uncultured Draconibacterium sp.]
MTKYFYVKSCLKRHIISNPKIYFTLLKLNGNYNERICQKDTDIVTEGFPRSANSFFVNALRVTFRIKNRPIIKIAHHNHSVAQIKVGLKYNIPIVILIRKPSDAIASFILMQNHSNIKNLIKDYISFYSYVSKVKKKVLIITFSEIINNYPGAIKKINIKYGLDFPQIMDGNIKKLTFQEIKKRDNKNLGKDNTEKHGIPSDKKEMLKKEIIKEIESIPIYYKAEQLYNSLT